MASPFARELMNSDVFERTRALSEGATSLDVARRRATAEALATGVGDLGALSAVQHLARDADDDVRAAAVTAAAMRLQRAPGRYGAVVRDACDDEARRRPSPWMP